MKPLSTERPTQLRLHVPARPPAHASAAAASLRHYPSYLHTPSSSAKPYPFSPLPTPTPSKRPGAKPWLPWLCTLLYLSSLYWLNTTLDPTISSVPFTFLALLLSAVVTCIGHRQPSRNRPLAPLQHATLAADGAMLAAVFVLRFSGCRACGPMEAILAEFAGALAGKSLLEAAKPPHRGRKMRGLVALAAGIFLLSQGFDRAGCFLAGSSDRTACSRIFRLAAPLAAGLMASLEKHCAGRSSIRHLGKRRIRLISLSIAAGILFPFAVISFFLRDSNPGPLHGSSAVWPLIGALALGVVSSFYGETYSEEKLLMPSMSSKPYFTTICCSFILELIFGLELSLLGFVLISFILWIAVRDLGSPSGIFSSILESDPSEAFSSLVKNPLHHILSERKSRKIAIFLVINTAFMAVEFIFGFMSNSLGLISDACHMLFDCAALAIGLYASYISRLPANGKFNYGYGRFEVLSGYVNAVFLVLVGSLIVLESLERILDPQEISTESLLIVSVGGLLVNIVGLVFFHEEHHYAHSHGGGCSHSQSNESHSHDHIHDCPSQSHSHTCTIKTENCEGNRSKSSMQQDAHRGGQLSLIEDHQIPHIHMCHNKNNGAGESYHPMLQTDNFNGHNDMCHEQHKLSSHGHLIQGEHQQWLHDHPDKRDNSMHSDLTKDACGHLHNGNSEERHYSHEHNNSHSHYLEPSHSHSANTHSGDSHSEGHNHKHSHSDSEHSRCHSGHGHSHSVHGHLHSEHSHSDLERSHSHSANLHSGDSHSEEHNHSHSHSDLEHSDCHSGHGHSHSAHGHSHSGHCHSEEHNHSHSHSDLEHSDCHSEHSHSAERQKSKDHHHIDHNMEGIFLHVLADTLGSVGVVASTLLIKYKGWLIADPACSIFISVLIISSVIPLLRNAAEILLQRVPRANEHDIKQTFKDILKIQGVHDFQNMHVWSFTNKEVVGTLHLHIYSESDKKIIGTQVARVLHDAGIKDLTLQMEYVGNS